MKNFFKFIIANMCIIVLFSSCGKANSDKPSSVPDTPGVQSNSEVITSEENNKETKKEITPKEGTSGKPNAETTQEPEDKQELTKASIDTQTGYADAKHQVNIIGFKSYKKLESKLYKDKAGKNKEFLVLFLEISNSQNDNDYINVNYLTAKVDGKKTENKVLFNDPEGFKTVFQNIGPGKTAKGFVAWEVPSNWKEIKVVYNGWKDSDNLSINCTLTPDDYFLPPKYN